MYIHSPGAGGPPLARFPLMQFPKPGYNYLGLWRSFFPASNSLGCRDGLLVVPELDPLVDTDEDASSLMFSPSDRAMALINSSCSPSMSEGPDLKLEPGASELEGAS